VHGKCTCVPFDPNGGIRLHPDEEVHPPPGDVPWLGDRRHENFGSSVHRSVNTVNTVNTEHAWIPNHMIPIMFASTRDVSTQTVFASTQTVFASTQTVFASTETVFASTQTVFASTETVTPPDAGVCAARSRFVGVVKREGSSKWRASIADPNTHRKMSLGSYASEVDAARAYDCEVVKLRGPHAKRNFPDEIISERPESSPNIPGDKFDKLRRL
jgi:hypothetical protein